MEITPIREDDERGGGERKVDELWYDAAKFLLDARVAKGDAGVGSTAALQARFSIGHPRAVRLMRQLEEFGIVGPNEGTKPRNVVLESPADLERIADRIGRPAQRTCSPGDRAALAIGVAAAAVATCCSGNAVSHAPPHGIDVAGRALAGRGAARRARLHRVVLVGDARRARRARSRSSRSAARRGGDARMFAIPTTLITWQVSDALKNVFRRPRPEYWTLIHEPSFSYSSGHAMFAVLVYGLWAWFVWRSDLPRTVRTVLSVVLALWGCAVIWSRLALGAHFVTDLIGGVLLATTAIAVASAIAAAVSRRGRAGATLR